MEYKWLNKKNNKKLIVFFNGWGMDENVVKHLKPEDYDVIMFYDYNNLDMDLSLLEEYEQKHLVSWSMGVMTATLFNIKYNTSTAINGTLKPIDDKFGIPVKIYDLTLNNFNQNSSQKFIQNMFEKGESVPPIEREFENIKKELAALKNYKADSNFKYTKILLSNKDRIIPSKNQSAFWKLAPNTEGGHCLFYKFEYWSELI